MAANPSLILSIFGCRWEARDGVTTQCDTEMFRKPATESVPSLIALQRELSTQLVMLTSSQIRSPEDFRHMASSSESIRQSETTTRRQQSISMPSLFTLT